MDLLLLFTWEFNSVNEQRIAPICQVTKCQAGCENPVIGNGSCGEWRNCVLDNVLLELQGIVSILNTSSLFQKPYTVKYKCSFSSRIFCLARMYLFNVIIQQLPKIIITIIDASSKFITWGNFWNSSVLKLNVNKTLSTLNSDLIGENFSKNYT